jgi:hypothetical protein
LANLDSASFFAVASALDFVYATFNFSALTLFTSVLATSGLVVGFVFASLGWFFFSSFIKWFLHPHY